MSNLISLPLPVLGLIGQHFASLPQGFRRGDRLPVDSRGVWFIEEGAVRTLGIDQEGMATTLGIWGPGDIVGGCLLDWEQTDGAGYPPSGSQFKEVECLTEVQAVLLVVKQWPDATTALIQHIQRAQTFNKIQRQRKVLTAVIELLQWLVFRFGQRVDEGWQINLRLTHQLIAEMVGTTRVTVTRILNDLEQDGIIERNPGHRLILVDNRKNQQVS
ncbi:MAG: Crp/Fnr family transcriptional regulator [Synechococcales cyanobacterium]